MSGLFGIVSGAHGRPRRRVVHAFVRACEQWGCNGVSLLAAGERGWHLTRAATRPTRLLKSVDWRQTHLLMAINLSEARGSLRVQLGAENDSFHGVCGHVVPPPTPAGAPRAPHPSDDAPGQPARHLVRLLQLIARGDAPASLTASALSGVFSGVLVDTAQSRVALAATNGDLYVGTRDGDLYFASQKGPLAVVGCTGLQQISGWAVIAHPLRAMRTTRLDPPDSSPPRPREPGPDRLGGRLAGRPRTVAATGSAVQVLCPDVSSLRRCTRCILPETMPYIDFDAQGVCNYCRHHTPARERGSLAALRARVAPYRRASGADCIVPFSGGRDSLYTLHLAVTALGLRPITYTYDWGMITEVGFRNLDRVCARLGVERVVVAADIAFKRRNIARNLAAWLRRPDIGMLGLLTAGDKHFFRHIETVKQQQGIALNLWGINPLETTHFKAGFLGMPPVLDQQSVYSRGLSRQLHYQSLRFARMLRNPGYFNRSLWDTLSGEYYRSVRKKTDYFHVFDYCRWDEDEVDAVLATYQWENPPESHSTWRVGDGTAAFYNYVYRLVAGFTEHDTFRSNQIREGSLDRERALALVARENQPQPDAMAWYLDTLGFDFKDVLQIVNRQPRLYA